MNYKYSHNTYSCKPNNHPSGHVDKVQSIPHSPKPQTLSSPRNSSPVAMHLWPTLKIRESFKLAYLTNAERNLNRMNYQKQKQQADSASTKLLDSALVVDGGNPSRAAIAISKASSGISALLWDFFVVFSCCFCCGACEAEDEEW
ncbi:hypothetical protein Droror1_Dr00016859 [Drosera rotundifolia]